MNKLPASSKEGLCAGKLQESVIASSKLIRIADSEANIESQKTDDFNFGR